MVQDRGGAEFQTAGILLVVEDLKPSTNPAEKGGRPKDIFEIGSKMIQAIILNFAGRPEEAIELIKKAMRPSPLDPGWFLYPLGMSYRLRGQYDEAIETLKKCREHNPADIRSYTELGIVYSQLGQMEEAQAPV